MDSNLCVECFIGTTASPPPEAPPAYTWVRKWWLAWIGSLLRSGMSHRSFQRVPQTSASAHCQDFFEPYLRWRRRRRYCFTQRNNNFSVSFTGGGRFILFTLEGATNEWGTLGQTRGKQTHISFENWAIFSMVVVSCMGEGEGQC